MRSLLCSLILAVCFVSSLGAAKYEAPAIDLPLMESTPATVLAQVDVPLTSPSPPQATGPTATTPKQAPQARTYRAPRAGVLYGVRNRCASRVAARQGYRAEFRGRTCFMERGPVRRLLSRPWRR